MQKSTYSCTVQLALMASHNGSMLTSCRTAKIGIADVIDGCWLEFISRLPHWTWTHLFGRIAQCYLNHQSLEEEPEGLLQDLSGMYKS